MTVVISFERRRCGRCNGTGELKSARARAVGRRKPATCPECMGSRYHETRTTWRAPDSVPTPPPPTETWTAYPAGRTYVIEGVEWEEI